MYSQEEGFEIALYKGRNVSALNIEVVPDVA